MANIIHIDDASADTAMMKSILSGAGHSVTSYNDPTGVEEKVAAAKPSLVLLDVVMPQRNGYDVLRALDYFRGAGERPDPRMAEAVEHVRSRQQPDGRWLLDRTHEGTVFFDLEHVGEPSRWNTLRALRVLRWWDTAT